ncbi:sporulation integral membrane protein YlbJ [Salipaludibacillus aurantiacus]|uniref:Sporulation integral membrane protein YlbJ n=1 Tax=Salipaludibacillus aurantiacus TaxID=1601833 RepID=A0A1H9X2C6_9BACI|nr:sporulation integral membrane protein YlbJ [Salipaludibacillus aurantiacus]SES39793.1 sporulation integral membrane protein YlbJ [Salipaludibacillus aurantiacus]
MSRIQLIKTFLYGISATFLAGCFMVFPKEAYEASVRGMTVWWEVVFPSLLPFFILSEFLIRFGVVSFLGTLFEPLMRPLFRVPGSGGFVWAMGLASGFPSGAKLTARLRQEGHVTQIEGERLASFTNASNPLFIFGAIAVGFFQNASIGLLLAAAHYGGNLIVGLVMRFHGRSIEQSKPVSARSVSFTAALRKMHHDRLNQQEPLGKMMGDAINSSIHTLLMIGGFMIFFSVLNQILEIIRFSDVVSLIISILLVGMHMPDALSPGIIAGLFEITLGSQRISGVSEATLLQQAVITSFILAFNGFSVQAQVASILSSTDIRFMPFFIARCIHAAVSAVLAFVLFTPLYTDRISEASLPVNSELVTDYTFQFIFIKIYDWLILYGSLVTLLSLLFWFCYNLKKD